MITYESVEACVYLCLFCLAMDNLVMRERFENRFANSMHWLQFSYYLHYKGSNKDKYTQNHPKMNQE